MIRKSKKEEIEIRGDQKNPRTKRLEKKEIMAGLSKLCPRNYTVPVIVN